MARAVELMQRPFLRRVHEPRWWSRVAYTLPRVPLAVALALVPLVLVALAAWLGPAGLRGAIVDPKNVQETFARYVSAVATASAIAVSVATLTLGRELKGIQRQQERAKVSEAFRDRVRRASGREAIPLSLGPFMATAFEALRDTARRARRAATREELDRRTEDVTLGELLDTIESSAERARARMLDDTRHPHTLARHALDFEEELSGHLARQFARLDRFGPDLQGALEDLEERMVDVVTGVKYLKTLDIQWGLSRMSVAITVTTLPSILTASAMVLAYGKGLQDAVGEKGAALVVGLALSVCALPIACFVSYILRFVFMNEHTLPTDSFVLGPEEWEVAEGEHDSAPGPSRRKRARGA